MSELLKHLNIYEFETKLPGSEIDILYKGLSTNTIKKLIVYENENDPLKEEDILDYFISLAILNEDFNIDEWYVMDRYYMFIKIREATKGSKFEFEYKCKNKECKNILWETIDLNDLIVYKPEKFEDEIKLKSVTFKVDYPKRKDQKEILKLIDKKISDNNKRIEMSLADIASYIQEVHTKDGKLNVDYKEIMEFIGGLPESELDKINEWRERNDFGINFTHTIKCKKCGLEEKIALPVNNFFL